MHDEAAFSDDNRRVLEQPKIDNKTDFFAHAQRLLDRDGEKLALIVKATFEHSEGGDFELAPPKRARGLRFADIPWEETKPASIAYPADLCLRKAATDVVLVATAHAPQGKAAPSIDVRVEAGPLKKSLVVFGPRIWTKDGIGLSSPAPILALDMRYDFAWGGTDDSDPDNFIEEPRNPVGMGISRSPQSLTHKAAPQIEDPSYPIQSSKTSPPPAGIGAIGRNFEPRRKYAGTYDLRWQEERAPLLPDDYDERFNQCASPGLMADPPLKGGEQVRLLNLIPGGGALSFQIPKISLEIQFHIEGKAPAIFQPHLDTLLIDLLAIGPKKPPTIELIYRAHTKAPRKLGSARILIRERKSS